MCLLYYIRTHMYLCMINLHAKLLLHYTTVVDGQMLKYGKMFCLRLYTRESIITKGLVNYSVYQPLIFVANTCVNITFFFLFIDRTKYEGVGGETINNESSLYFQWLNTININIFSMNFCRK